MISQCRVDLRRPTWREPTLGRNDNRHEGRRFTAVYSKEIPLSASAIEGYHVIHVAAFPILYRVMHRLAPYIPTLGPLGRTVLGEQCVCSTGGPHLFRCPSAQNGIRQVASHIPPLGSWRGLFGLFPHTTELRNRHETCRGLRPRTLGHSQAVWSSHTVQLGTSSTEQIKPASLVCMSCSTHHVPCSLR